MRTRTSRQFAQKIARSLDAITQMAEPVIGDNADKAARRIEKYAPKRTYGKGVMKQVRTGVVEANPYLVGEYRGRTMRPPNRRFLVSALADTKPEYVRDITRVVARVLES